MPEAQHVRGMNTAWDTLLVWEFLPAMSTALARPTQLSFLMAVNQIHFSLFPRHRVSCQECLERTPRTEPHPQLQDVLLRSEESLTSLEVQERCTRACSGRLLGDWRDLQSWTLKMGIWFPSTFILGMLK